MFLPFAAAKASPLSDSLLEDLLGPPTLSYDFLKPFPWNVPPMWPFSFITRPECSWARPESSIHISLWRPDLIKLASCLKNHRYVTCTVKLRSYFCLALCFKLTNAVTYMIQRVHSRGWICSYKRGYLSEMLMEQKTNISAAVLTLMKAMEAFWIPGPLSRASVVTPHLYIHKWQFLRSQNLLILMCSSSSSSSCQVNTARLRLMNVVPSPVSTMEHVLTYRDATHASVLQVCGHVTRTAWCPLWHLNSSVTFWTHLWRMWREMVG